MASNALGEINILYHKLCIYGTVYYIYILVSTCGIDFSFVNSAVFVAMIVCVERGEARCSAKCLTLAYVVDTVKVAKYS